MIDQCPVCPTLSPDALLAAITGLVGALGATGLTLWHARKQAQAQRDNDRLEQRFLDLRDAYIDWLGAAYRAHDRVQTLKEARPEQRSELLAEVEVGRDTFFAWKLLVLEPDLRLLRKVRAAIKTYHFCMRAFRQGAAPQRITKLETALTKGLYSLRKKLNERYRQIQPLAKAKSTAATPTISDRK